MEQVQISLESIYLDYYDGLYYERQLKIVLKNLYLQLDISIEVWSELLLEAQWKHAIEVDYEIKRKQLLEETH